jgi:predicted DNA repair protein MutK
MLWVGGNIVVHGLEVTHLWLWPYASIHHLAQVAAAAVPTAAGLVGWFVTAFFDGIFGLILGAALVFAMEKAIAPLWRNIR